MYRLDPRSVWRRLAAERARYEKARQAKTTDQLLIRTANLSSQQGEWSAMLLEAQWQKATQHLLVSEMVDPAHPWGGALSAFAFQGWWAGVGLSTTRPMFS